MALILPYPNLDFVPLDVLTAEEMNEIVANYTYIANQFPIATNNIDSTTMGAIGDYSLAELETPFKDWNGDIIYKKTVDCGALPDSSFKSVPHNISGLKNVVLLTGIAYNPTSGARLVLPGANPNTGYSTSIAILNTTIDIGTGVDRTAFIQTFITVYYTKTS